ncbi:uncharacterized protein LOC143032693 [Oratosquilla oratoria]|uniref:uncharacterized protein LOC143032693 n=1 Tax=Oratosquilla oratoria TaxID=337810 RepID=UPI003F75C633
MRYRAFDRELLAIFSAVKHFLYFLEGRPFTILTDHKPLTHALDRISDHHSPRVSRQLSFLSQFDTHIEYIKGEDNQVADALSRITSSILPDHHHVDYARIAASQGNDEELRLLRLHDTSSLQLRQLPNTPAPLWCDVSTGKPRQYIPACRSKDVFSAFHDHSHPGWVSRFGAPHAIITDRGSQFESDLWPRMLKFLGTNCNRTTAYHPQATGLVEKFHRQLKESLKVQQPSCNWADALPLVLLSIRNTPKVDSDVSISQLVHDGKGDNLACI